MIAYLVIFLSGVVFALGLGISGMTQPSKIVGFLDFIGDWDPSLLMVMAGAVSTYFVLQRLILKRSRPLLAASFFLPTRLGIDRPLIIGAMIFGIGWGMVGFCPGPALVSAVTGNPSVLIFILAMCMGMSVCGILHTRLSREP